MGLNVVQIKEEGEEMDTVIENAMAIINLYPDIFPHMYKQGFKLVSRIQEGNIVLQDGVVITFHQYSGRTPVTRNSMVKSKAKGFMIHQIASDLSTKGNTKTVLDEFVTWCKEQGAPEILLSVRAFNDRARAFYERYGFEYVEKTHWHKKGEDDIPGIIYRLPLQEIDAEKFFTFN